MTAEKNIHRYIRLLSGAGAILVLSVLLYALFVVKPLHDYKFQLEIDKTQPFKQSNRMLIANTNDLLANKKLKRRACEVFHFPKERCEEEVSRISVRLESVQTNTVATFKLQSAQPLNGDGPLKNIGVFINALSRRTNEKEKEYHYSRLSAFVKAIDDVPSNISGLNTIDENLEVTNLLIQVKRFKNSLFKKHQLNIHTKLKLPLSKQAPSLQIALIQQELAEVLDGLSQLSSDRQKELPTADVKVFSELYKKYEALEKREMLKSRVLTNWIEQQEAGLVESFNHLSPSEFYLPIYLVDSFHLISEKENNNTAHLFYIGAIILAVFFSGGILLLRSQVRA